MSEPKTQNLGLNKIDRSSPSTTYFDLDKYLDQNWEKIDDFSEQVEEKVEETTAQVSSIQDRLDTEQRKSVTLEPGLQIINAERASAFKLEGLKGRTLVNLLGSDGGFEGHSNWGIGAASATLDNTVYAKGSMSSLKVTLASTNSNISKAVSTSVGKTYVLVADVKNVSTSSTFVSISTVVNGNIVTGSTFGTSFARFTATSSTHAIAVVGGGVSGQVFNADNVRLYEVSAAEYAALNSMTPEQVAAKYPYVDSVQPVRNPYAIRYGENLLPPWYEWTAGATSGLFRLLDENRFELSKSSGTVGFLATGSFINVAASTEYTLSLTVDMTNIGGDISAGAYWNMAAYDEAGAQLEDYTQGPFVTANGTTTMTCTFITPANTKFVRVVIGLDNGTTGNAIFRDSTLNIGNTAKSFKPREDAMLALQTALFADPVTGANADEMFERGGQYFKLAKWRRLILDGALAWVYGDAVSAGLKQVKVVGLVTGGVAASGIATKYNGKIIPQGSTGSVADTNAVTGTGDFYISIPNIDSGWGDSYTPTTDEIKAYFMGWRMANSGDWGPYNGTGTKAWKNILRYQDTGGETAYILPTTKVPNWAPYQLLYQLATPSVEPITSEGQLTFNEGDNQIEVGTGIVLRENAIPYRDPTTKDVSINAVSCLLKNKASKILHLYTNSVINFDWDQIPTTHAASVNGAWINLIGGPAGIRYNPSTTYTVTYLMRDTSPIAPFTGLVAENEKALLTDLVQYVQQANARLSVAESKKAEKDAPAWITPTLLNGWVSFGPSFPTAQFYKDSNGIVRFRGFIKFGLVNALLLNLPKGYRPSAASAMPVVSATDAAGAGLSSGTINIQPDGQVQTAVNVKNGFLTLEGISFPAEQ